MQVSIYLTQEEITYLDCKCDETFLARNLHEKTSCRRYKKKKQMTAADVKEFCK
ncbi:hypothetical protein [Campylobacter concisus]|uniref:hypothetical protein n=1 Tax=Campylobacter concisus TaxID=199 RepID=UPI0015E19972|nr:hypothetical protein [Campylobacter concisus]